MAPLGWAYANNGGVITATGTDGGGRVCQTYTFAACSPAADQPWTARTCCTGAFSS